MENRSQQEMMVSQQVKTWGVTSDALLEAMIAVPRESFVSAQYKNFAYADMVTPIRFGQVMLSPAVQARLIEALDLQSQDTVLEIGTGTGYLSALLGKVAKSVLSIDAIRQFSDDAALKMVEMGINNVTFKTGDASQSWSSQVQFDAILVTGSMPYLSEGYKNLLSIGGRIVAVVGEAEKMEAVRVRRISNADWTVDSLFDTTVPPLKNIIPVPEFEF